MCSDCLHRETCKYREKLERGLSKDIKRLAKRLGIPAETLEITCSHYQHQPAITMLTQIDCDDTATISNLAPYFAYTN